MAAGMAAAAVFGLLFQSLLSNYFGAGAETDAFFMSVSIFAFLSKFMMLGALKSIALPIYQRKEDSDEGLGGLLRLVLLTLSGVVLLLSLGAPWIVKVLAPGFDAESAALTTQLLRIRLPALVLTAVTTVGLVALEARSRFGLSVSANKVVPAVATFLGLVWLTDRFGIHGVAWIGLSGTVAGFAFLMLNWPTMFRGSARGAARDPEVRGIGKRWMRFSQSTAATMAGEWAFRIGASLLPVGVFSAVLYGRRVHDVLHGAINDSVNTVTLPELSRATAHGPAEVGARLRNRIEALAAVSLPLAGITILCAPWIVSTLFGRGRFLEDGLSGPTAVALSIYVMGFAIQGINQLFFSAAYATDQSRLVNRVQTIGHVVRALILIPLTLWLGYVGLVAGQVFMNGLVLVCVAVTWPRELRLSGGWVVRRLARVSGALLPSLVALWWVLETAGPPGAYPLVQRAGLLAVAGAGALLVYGLSATALGIQLPRAPWGRSK